MGKCEQCIIRELSSLKALSKEELLQLSRHKNSLNIKKGEVIFSEGDIINGVYCIKEGTCKMLKMNSNGKDTILKLISRGSLLGQDSMLTDRKASLSAVAVEDMKICFIPKSEVLGFIDKNNKFSFEITKDVCTQLDEANNIAAIHAHKTVKERLAHVLVDLFQSNGADDTGVLNLQLSREEIANMVGTATESCIRLLSELRKSGHIDLNGKKIRIIDLKALKKMAE